jgi:peroxiredoxin
MHGNNEMKISVPGTFLVDKNGLVKNVFVETDWHRSETRAALEWMMPGEEN